MSSMVATPKGRGGGSIATSAFLPCSGEDDGIGASTSTMPPLLIPLVLHLKSLLPHKSSTALQLICTEIAFVQGCWGLTRSLGESQSHAWRLCNIEESSIKTLLPQEQHMPPTMGSEYQTPSVIFHLFLSLAPPWTQSSSTLSHLLLQAQTRWG